MEITIGVAMEQSVVFYQVNLALVYFSKPIICLVSGEMLDIDS